MREDCLQHSCELIQLHICHFTKTCLVYQAMAIQRFTGREEVWEQKAEKYYPYPIWFASALTIQCLQRERGNVYAQTLCMKSQRRKMSVVYLIWYWIYPEGWPQNGYVIFDFSEQFRKVHKQLLKINLEKKLNVNAEQTKIWMKEILTKSMLTWSLGLRLVQVF